MSRTHFVLLLALFSNQAAVAQDAAHFTFTWSHELQTPNIEARFTGLEEDHLTIAMPAWRPGSYYIQDFGKNVLNLQAIAKDGTELSIEMLSANSWSVACAGQDEVTLRYELKLGIGNYTGVPKQHEDDDGNRWRTYQAYLFHGPATWLYVPGHIDIPQQLNFAIPADWQVATGLQASDDPRAFSAPDFDTFADCPMHVGKFERLSFEHAKVHYEVVLSGFERDTNDRQAILDRYRKIVIEQTEMMGPAPFDQYVFLIRKPAIPGGSGLEHLNSTNITMMDLSGSSEARNNIWDSIVSHEFFHLWNVKRLRPEALGPFDYSQPNRTHYLWLAEGVTSYYGDMLLVRAGVWNEEGYWTGTIAGEINTLQRNPGRKKMSVADASWTVWSGRAGRQAPDYYNKGRLIGLLLDIEIRDATDNQKSLDDVMRELYRECIEERRGFADGRVLEICEEIAGREFDQFFADYIKGTEELPFTETLAKIGIDAMPKMVTDAEGNQRVARWRVDYQPDASERALEIRTSMCR